VLTGIVLGAVVPRRARSREGMAPREGADAASTLPSDPNLPSARAGAPVVDGFLPVQDAPPVVSARRDGM